MLVLSRKTGERIQIGDDITIEIRRIAGNRVTIALEAPRDVRILRGELEAVARQFDDESADTHAEPHKDDTYDFARHCVVFDELAGSGTHERVG